MNKETLIKEVAEQAKITKAAASKAINALLDTVRGCLKNGDSVVLVGFGSFKISQRKARSGRNPRTGETISIPAATVPYFRAGKALKDAINKKK